MSRRAHVDPGARYGRLAMVSIAPSTAVGAARWLARCDCGREIMVIASLVKKGSIRSCGCLNRERVGALNRTHARSKSRTYKSWLEMWARCTNEKHISYPRYGGAGVTVCERWESFEAFLSDMGERPAGTSIDRKRNHLGYSPDNCRWATPLEQSHNSSSLRLSDDDVRAIRILRPDMTLVDLARRYGVAVSTIGNICTGRRRAASCGLQERR